MDGEEALMMWEEKDGGIGNGGSGQWCLMV